MLLLQGAVHTVLAVFLLSSMCCGTTNLGQEYFLGQSNAMFFLSQSCFGWSQRIAFWPFAKVGLEGGRPSCPPYLYKEDRKHSNKMWGEHLHKRPAWLWALITSFWAGCTWRWDGTGESEGEWRCVEVLDTLASQSSAMNHLLTAGK